MTPIERAARAMYDEVTPDWDWADPDAELLRVMYRTNARAALIALRHPDAAMRTAGESCSTAAEAWTAMIDAALAA